MPSGCLRNRAQRQAGIEPDLVQAIGYLLPGMQDR